MSQTHVPMQRARLLLQQGRYADAERELRQVLAADPNDALAHALLATALLDLQRLDEATAEAGLAITNDPEEEFGHFVMGRVLLGRNRPEEAEQAALRAIELAPYSRSFGLLAAARFDRRDWRGALAAADEGLATEPDDSSCLNLRAMALRQLGRHDEADATLRGALESDPDDSNAHANRGWSELHRGRPKEALVHFKESLRLDPSNDHARYGLVEAMKARYLFYRLLLGYFLWMNRLASSAQFAIIIGGWVGYQVLRGFARANPQYAWVTVPLIAAYIVFALLTWLAAPFMNLALRLHPVGKYALSTEQRRTANVVGGLMVAAPAIFVTAIATGVDGLKLVALYTAFAMLPGSLIFRADYGWPRFVLIGMTAGLVALPVVVLLSDLGVLPPAAGQAAAGLSAPAMLACLIGGQVIAAQRVKR